MNNNGAISEYKQISVLKIESIVVNFKSLIHLTQFKFLNKKDSSWHE